MVYEQYYKDDKVVFVAPDEFRNVKVGPGIVAYVYDNDFKDENESIVRLTIPGYPVRDRDYYIAEKSAIKLVRRASQPSSVKVAVVDEADEYKLSPDILEPFNPNQTKPMTNVIELYKNSAIKEPQKTLLKAGLVTKDNSLTSDGSAILLEILRADEKVAEKFLEAATAIIAARKEEKED